MSIRSHPNGPINGRGMSAAPSSAIDFKDEFVNSTAALAASHDDTVSHILQRLDQLQSKIGAQPEVAAAPRAREPPIAANNNTRGGDLHARLSQLENIHEDALQHLGAKLDVVERKLSDNKEAENLMGKISSKFEAIQSQLSSNKEAEALMSKIANKFSQVETRLQSAAQLHDRVNELETRLEAHSDLHSRLSKLERADVHSRVAKLEAHLEPDPEQERILARINSKLDQLERNKAQQSLRLEEPSRSLGASYNDFSRRHEGGESRSRLGASYEPEPERRSMDRQRGLSVERHPTDEFLGSDAERNQRIQYLQTRIEKLKELRSRYEDVDESGLMAQ